MAIENMTTNKDEGSSAFGERLLKTTKIENRAKEKAFRRREDRKAQQAKIMGIGTSVGLGLGNAYFQNKADAFLNTEQMTQNVLTTRNAYDATTTIDATQKQLEAYKGGENAFWAEQGMNLARPTLDKKFGPAGTYRQIQYDRALQGIGVDVGNKLKAAHIARVKAKNEYMSTRGVHEGKDAYLTEIKKSNPQNLQQGITKGLGKLMGLTPDEQISAKASSIYDSAVQLNAFQATYKLTGGDASLSAIIAEHVPEGFDFKDPAIKYGTIEKVVSKGMGLFGDEETTEFVRPVTVYSRATGETATTLVTVTRDGEALGQHSKRQTRAKRGMLISAARVAENPARLNVGYALMQDLSPGTRDKLNSQVQLALGKFKYTEPKYKNEFIAESEKQMASYLAAAALGIQDDLGVTPKRAGQIALDIFSRNPDFSLSQGAFKNGVGVDNPYGTLRSMSETSTMGSTRFNEQAYINLSGKDGVNFIRSYLDSSADERKEVNADLAVILAGEPDGGAAGQGSFAAYERLKKDKQIADILSKEVLDLETYSLVEYVAAAERRLDKANVVKMPDPAPAPTTATATTTATTAAPEPPAAPVLVDISKLTVPVQPSMLSRTTTGRGTATPYGIQKKLYASIQEDLATLKAAGDYSKQRFTAKSYKPIEERLASNYKKYEAEYGTITEQT